LKIVEEPDLLGFGEPLDAVDHAHAAAALHGALEGAREVALACALFAPHVDDTLGQAALHDRVERVQQLAVAAGDEVGEGGRGGLGEVEEELPHAYFRGLRRRAGVRFGRLDPGAPRWQR
jgi:hypothetical protein